MRYLELLVYQKKDQFKQCTSYVLHLYDVGKDVKQNSQSI